MTDVFDVKNSGSLSSFIQSVFLRPVAPILPVNAVAGNTASKADLPLTSELPPAPSSDASIGRFSGAIKLIYQNDAGHSRMGVTVAGPTAVVQQYVLNIFTEVDSFEISVDVAGDRLAYDHEPIISGNDNIVDDSLPPILIVDDLGNELLSDFLSEDFLIVTGEHRPPPQGFVAQPAPLFGGFVPPIIKNVDPFSSRMGYLGSIPNATPFPTGVAKPEDSDQGFDAGYSILVEMATSGGVIPPADLPITENFMGFLGPIFVEFTSPFFSEPPPTVTPLFRTFRVPAEVRVYHA